MFVIDVCVQNYYYYKQSEDSNPKKDFKLNYSCKSDIMLRMLLTMSMVAIFNSIGNPMHTKTI